MANDGVGLNRFMKKKIIHSDLLKKIAKLCDKILLPKTQHCVH